VFEVISLSWPLWILLALCCFLIGTAKAGLTGSAMAVVPIMAHIFGGKPSTGIVLPLLIVADIFTVVYYHRHANWKHLGRVMPWALAGIAAGLFAGQNISDQLFKRLIGIVILAGIGFMIWKDVRKSNVLPDSGKFAAALGVLGGFATMIGNAAGPIFAVYLLLMRLPKLNYIGTTAWFFFIVNLVKIPLHVGVWKTISFKTMVLDLLLAPAVIIGVFAGIKIVKVIPEKYYRILIVSATSLSALLLFM
jgi:uncharacterized membrane protein YfcA